MDNVTKIAKKTISVIIPVFNGENTIERCLYSLGSQTISADEIIVVDSSNDRTPSIVREKFPNIHFIHLNKKTDAGRARNIGIEKATGRIIAFTDADCIADRKWIENIKKAHSKADVVGGCVKNGNPWKIIGWASYLMEFTNVLPDSKARLEKHLPTCNISFKRRIFDEHGTFQDGWWPAEDRIFSYTIRAKGEKIVFDPSIQIKHINRSSLNSFIKHQIVLGKISALCGKKFQNMESRRFVENKILALTYPIGKCGMIALRLLKRGKKYSPIALLVSPLFFLGISLWGFAFIREAYKK